MIEIVTHCWSPLGTRYAELLRWQLTSIVENPPRCQIEVSIFLNSSDYPTCETVAEFQSVLDLSLHYVPKQQLFRRAIGRNQVCGTTRADVVWFTDCDYLFGAGCLDSVAEQVRQDGMLYYPQQVLTSRTHKDGDRVLNELAGGWDFNTAICDWESFYSRKQTNAIGGVQIVTGETARQYGYLRGTKWVKPLDDVSQGFLSCKCDAAWRRKNQFPKRSIDVPNCYRIRHLINGRDL